ncbi:hypothetical protein X798_00258 [Onchocerca flexuosa]|uniref:Uncharacterized protein n=1 Tax=Onchocerca flexuosa TaxID=387005 RepID=A0A238C586_9BILA|nr:hypothetical protein X798_00258 [Onchocerca flexuosa]
MNSGSFDNFSDGKNAAAKLQFKGKADGEVKKVPSDLGNPLSQPNVTNLLQHDAVEHGRQNSTKSTAIMERGLFLSLFLFLCQNTYFLPFPSLIIDKSIGIFDEQEWVWRDEDFKSGDGEGRYRTFSGGQRLGATSTLRALQSFNSKLAWNGNAIVQAEK